MKCESRTRKAISFSWYARFLFGMICFWLVRDGENIFLLELLELRLGSIFSYYCSSRNIVQRRNYWMEKMTSWGKVQWGSIFCRVCVSIQCFFSPSSICITLILHLVCSRFITSAWILILFFLSYAECYISLWYSIFYVVISKAYYSFHKHYNKNQHYNRNLYLLDPL